MSEILDVIGVWALDQAAESTAAEKSRREFDRTQGRRMTRHGSN